MRMRIKRAWRANALGIGGQGQDTAVLMIDLLPGLKCCQFGVNNQTIKIEDETLHSIRFIVAAPAPRSALIFLSLQPHSPKRLPRPVRQADSVRLLRIPASPQALDRRLEP